jgi:hypothetical protein
MRESPVSTMPIRVRSTTIAAWLATMLPRHAARVAGDAAAVGLRRVDATPTRAATGQSPAGSGANRMEWLLAAVAFLPMALVYLLHCLRVPAGYSPTGFLQYDQASYMANARAVFEHGFALTYGVPFSPFDDTPRIYFQPIAVLLGAIWAVTGWSPGVIYVGLGVISGIAMLRVALALATCFDGGRRDGAAWLARVALLWGGGISVLLGVSLYWLGAKLGSTVWQAAFALDFGDGYWFLDLGRNVYYAIEATNHVLFLGCIVLLLHRRYAAAFVVMLVQATNHPITGVELICVAGAFAMLEQVLQPPDAPPRWFVWATAGLLVAHLGYWLIALGLLSPEQRAIEQQWTQPNLMDGWALSVRDNIVAYLPVMTLAPLRLLRRPAQPGAPDGGTRRWADALPDALKQQSVRLALVWFCVTFALANHEVFMPARQPVHFTRGYVWTPLALLALPLLADMFRWTASLRRRRLGIATASLVLALALLDNATWFARHYRDLAVHTETNVLLLRDDQRAVLNRLAAPDMTGYLVLAEDPLMGYFATVYTGLRAWRSHDFNTPFVGLRQAELDRFFADGQEVPAWRHRPLVVLLDDTRGAAANSTLRSAGFAPVATYGHYTILERPES